MKKSGRPLARIIYAALFVACPLFAHAQYTFTANIRYFGSCKGDKAPEWRAWLQEIESMSVQMSWPTKQACEQQRRQIDGRSYSYTDSWKGRVYTCGAKVVTTPCTGRPLTGNGTANPYGAERGSSFYSVNPANENQDWSSDEIERRLALNGSPYGGSDTPLTADADFNYALENDFCKPFVSFNMRNGGYTSEDFNSFPDLWKLVKYGHNLPDANVDEYWERMQNESKDMLKMLLDRIAMTESQLREKLKDWNFWLNNYYLSESNRLQNEKGILERTFLLANYRVEYKATLNLLYQESHGETREAEVGSRLSEIVSKWLYDRKTNEEFYQESLQKMEEEMRASGISQEDIDKVKKQVDREALENNGIVKTIETGGIANTQIEKNAIVYDKERILNLVSDIASGASDGMELGVVIGDYIIYQGYKKVEDAIRTQLAEMDKRIEELNKFNQEESKKIQAISVLYDANSDLTKSRTATMTPDEKLGHARKTDFAMQEIEQGLREDYYGAFPKIHENEYVGREKGSVIFLECHW